ncbi:MAG: hypothetical protein IJ849_08890 [Selenomonadaceae bacterium]|nr:hypothetical protein [Selenomonadaceae bacterium]
MMEEFTGIQLIYKGLNPHLKLCADDRRCSLCGGRLIEGFDYLVDKAIGNSWTDTARQEAKDSDYLCAACWYMLKKQGKNAYWQNRNAVIFTPTVVRPLYTDEFSACLQEDFHEPRLFMLRAVGDSSVLQRHSEIQANHALSYRPEKIKICAYKLLLGDNMYLSGVVETNAPALLQKIAYLENTARHYIVPYIDAINAEKKGKDKWKPGGCRLHVMSKLRAAYLRGGISYGSPALSLAIFLAAYNIYPEKRKEGGDAP